MNGQLATWLGKNKRFVELSILDAILWASMAYFAYITLFLKDIGLSTGSIGVLLSVGAIVSIVTQPIWGSLCDRVLGVRKTLVVTVLFGAITTLGLVLFRNTVVIMIFYIMRAAIIAPIMMIFDSYIISRCAASGGKMQYGAIRIWGSISFALAVAAIGWLTERFGLQIAFYIQAAISFALIWLIMSMVQDGQVKDVVRKTNDKCFNKAIFSSTFVFVLAFVFLVMLSDNTLNSFYPLILQGAGGSLNMVGLSSSIRAIVEVPFFLSTTKLIKRIGARKLMLIAVAFYTLRILGFVLFSEPLHLLLANLLGAPAYCLFTAGMLHYVYDIAPEDSKTTAQLIVSSVGLSLSNVISSSAGGFVLENYGVRIMSLCSLILIMFALTFILMQNVSTRKIYSK